MFHSSNLYYIRSIIRLTKLRFFRFCFYLQVLKDLLVRGLTVQTNVCKYQCSGNNIKTDSADISIKKKVF